RHTRFSRDWSSDVCSSDLVRFRTTPGTGVHTGLRSLVLTGEQSNTTLVYGEEYVLKTFRRLWPGLNPDLELTSALAGAGSEFVEIGRASWRERCRRARLLA